ncbi:MAG: hypothetical protein K2J35_02735, partial [Eubacterium sp.]|nr:hypothetical protein [Eubacterium sp.]
NTVVQFEYVDGENTLAVEEIVISKGEIVIDIKKTAVPEVQQSEKRLFIAFENGRMIFNTVTGFVDSYIYNGKELVNQVPGSDFKGFGIQLYRAPLDNDMYFKKLWDKYRLEAQSSFIKKCGYTVSDDCIELTSRVTVKTPVKKKLAVVDVKLSVYGDGTVKADYNCIGAGAVKFIPRFGLQLEMPQEYSNVKYFGLGPDVNYPDFKEHAITGVFETAVADMREDYIKPQESGARCETRFAEITNDDGIGFRFEAVDKPFVFSANPFTAQSCAKAMHREDLKATTTCINIDSEMLGAGSNACGPVPAKEYQLGSLKGKTLSVVIKPVGE